MQITKFPPLPSQLFLRWLYTFKWRPELEWFSSKKKPSQQWDAICSKLQVQIWYFWSDLNLSSVWLCYSRGLNKNASVWDKIQHGVCEEAERMQQRQVSFYCYLFCQEDRISPIRTHWHSNNIEITMITGVFWIIFIIIIPFLFHLTLWFGAEHYMSEEGAALCSGGGSDSVRVRLSS